MNIHVSECKYYCLHLFPKFAMCEIAKIGGGTQLVINVLACPGQAITREIACSDCKRQGILVRAK